jgi:hypothetical protein
MVHRFDIAKANLSRLLSSPLDYDDVWFSRMTTSVLHKPLSVSKQHKTNTL